MKPGIVSDTIKKRSILKQMKADSASAETRLLLHAPMISEVEVFGNEKDLCIYGVLHAANHMFVQGGIPAVVRISIVLPEYAHESRIKAMVSYVAKFAREKKLQLEKVDVRIQPLISTTLVHVTCLGEKNETCRVGAIGRLSGSQSLVMVGYCGLEGSLRILNEKREELENRFAPSFLKPLEKTKESLYSDTITSIAGEQNVTAMWHVGEGGVYRTLWEVAECGRCGLSIVGEALPIRQETIEICELYGINPYQLTSAGSVVMATSEPENLVQALESQNIQAAVIGTVAGNNDKVIRFGGEIRFIDRPAPDELFAIWKQ